MSQLQIINLVHIVHQLKEALWVVSHSVKQLLAGHRVIKQLHQLIHFSLFLLKLSILVYLGQFHWKRTELEIVLTDDSSWYRDVSQWCLIVSMKEWLGLVGGLQSNLRVKSVLKVHEWSEVLKLRQTFGIVLHQTVDCSEEVSVPGHGY